MKKLITISVFLPELQRTVVYKCLREDLPVFLAGVLDEISGLEYKQIVIE